MNYRLIDIAKIVNGQVHGRGTQEIEFITVDSRIFSPSEKGLFVAIKGQHHDGHDYIQEILKKQISCFLVNRIPTNLLGQGANFIVVKDTLVAIQKWAAYHREQFKHPVIGITGSNGKTIVKEWIYQVLKSDYFIVRSPKSYNSQVGVPLSVLLTEEKHNLAIFEAGISLEGEMIKLQKIINPTIGIFTNIGDAHQENFSSLKQKLEEKLKLFFNTETIIYSKDNQMVDSMLNATKIFENKQLISWSKKYPADFSIERITKKSTATDIVGTYKNKQYRFSIPFVDEASLENSFHLILLLLFLNYDATTINERINGLFPVAMRLEMKKAINNSTIINDTYNSDINSLSIALDFLTLQHHHQKKTLILSDILQSGKEEFTLYQEVSRLLKQKNINRIIGVGEKISKFSDFFMVEKDFFENTESLLAALPKLNFFNEAILIKGARQFAFERVSRALQKKSHQTTLHINLNAIEHNLNFFRSQLAPTTKLMVMVKAFSYGNGSSEIANMLQYQKVDYLGVAFTDEGIALRNAGIYLPIMVLNPEPEAFEQLIENHLEPEISSFDLFQKFYKTLLKERINSYPIHIKINSGMNRLGFNPDEIETLAEILSSKSGIVVRSIFSHLASSDDPADDDFTRHQIHVFDETSQKLQEKIGYPIIRHILNTNGILRFKDAQFDMVRLGIGLYGFDALTEKDNLVNVSTLKTTVTHIKTINPPQTIGYNRKGKIETTTKIAIIPIGYAHGLNRRLSNGVGKVLINGQFAPIIGNINMDMTAVNITEIENVTIGNEVIIFDNNYTVEDIAKLLGTIPYEIMTGISPRVKRIYYHE